MNGIKIITCLFALTGCQSCHPKGAAHISGPKYLSTQSQATIYPNVTLTQNVVKSLSTYETTLDKVIQALSKPSKPETNVTQVTEHFKLGRTLTGLVITVKPDCNE